MAKTSLKVIKANGCRLISLPERSRSSFALTVVCRFLFLSLPAMPLTAVSRKSRLWVLDSVLEPLTGLECWRRFSPLNEVNTPVALSYLLPLKCYTSTNVLLKHLLLLWLVNSKQSCNNLISTLIMSLYASYVCLCILASSKIPQSILKRQTLHFWVGSVTVGTRVGLW
jgi:hypothetical protein